MGRLERRRWSDNLGTGIEQLACPKERIPRVGALGRKQGLSNGGSGGRVVERGSLVRIHVGPALSDGRWPGGEKPVLLGLKG